jgi:hypothetical protein
MIISVLWEDQYGAAPRNFGPHVLLVACVADARRCDRSLVQRFVIPNPRKGNAGVREALQEDGARLFDDGPVFAVLDRDKVRELWKLPGPMPPECMSAIAERFRQDAPGDYDLVFLVDNVESLLRASASILEQEAPKHKPTPNERDRILARLAWSDAAKRGRLLELCPSFERLVTRVAAQLAGHMNPPLPSSASGTAMP